MGGGGGGGCRWIVSSLESHALSLTPVYRENQEGLVVQGYSVKIVGGKHYSTLRGEYVELKTGMNFKLHVTNNTPKGKKLPYKC